MEIKDRIERYRLARGMTVQAFEEKCGLSNGTWARPSNLREDSLIKIIEAFPDLDPAWLLRGDADMEQTVLENARNKDKDMKELLTLCRSLIKSQRQHDKLMKELASMIERMEGQPHMTMQPTMQHDCDGGPSAMAEQVTMQYDDEATIIYNVKSAEMKPVKNCDTADSRLSGTPKMTDAPELRHSPSANSSGDCVSTGLAGNHPKPQKSCHLDHPKK